MIEPALLDRPAATPQIIDAPLARRELLATRGLMLHQLCSLARDMRAVAVREILSEHGLDLRDWLVLSTLCELGTATQREIVGAGVLDKVAVNRAVSRLKGRGLVTSRPNLSDRRSHHLGLTGRGNAIMIACSGELLELERNLLDRFSPRERSELKSLLQRFAGYVARMG